MGFLLAKILGLLVVAAACGAWLSYWWFRRNYQDVTLEYTRWRQEWAAWRRDFEGRLSERPQVDLRPVSQQIAAVDAAVRGIHIPRIPAPEPVNLEPLHARLDAIEQRLADISNAQPLDLGIVLDQLSALQAKLESSAAPFATESLQAPGAPDVADALETTHTLKALELTEATEALGTPEAPGTAEMFDPPQVSIREGSRNLLSYPGHGKPDDLTRIKGVKRVMERTLHDVGVFYFWQIADWSEEDIEHMHDILPEFRGRIERDEWVEQASELATEPDAAAPPEVSAKEH